VTQKYGMKINVKKTKVMCIARQGGRKVKILLDGQKVEQVIISSIWDLSFQMMDTVRKMSDAESQGQRRPSTKRKSC